MYNTSGNVQLTSGNLQLASVNVNLTSVDLQLTSGNLQLTSINVQLVSVNYVVLYCLKICPFYYWSKICLLLGSLKSDRRKSVGLENVAAP